MNVADVVGMARPGSRWSKRAITEVSKCFARIRAANGGTITAELVLDEARLSTSPLHRYFEWDDSKAAERWRLEQARKLIQAHYVVVTMPGEAPQAPMRADVVVTTPAGRAYVPTTVAMSNDDYSDQVLKQAERDLRSWIDRYSRFSRLHRAVAQAREALSEIRP